MGTPHNDDKGPTHGGAAGGYSDSYDAERSKSVGAGATLPRRHLSVEADDTSIKNPEGEFDNPAPMVHRSPRHVELGPNGAGNSQERDPQGQQGGTYGGQGSHPGRPSTPLATPEERIEQSTQQRTGGHSRNLELP